MMEVMEIAANLSQLNYRVTSEYIRYKSRFEIIIEPWDWQKNTRMKGRTKRTGYFFQLAEVNKPGSAYHQKIKEVQLKLIDHLKNKKPVQGRSSHNQTQ